MSDTRTVGGVVRARWDDTTTTFTEFAADGITVALANQLLVTDRALMAVLRIVGDAIDTTDTGAI